MLRGGERTSELLIHALYRSGTRALKEYLHHQSQPRVSLITPWILGEVAATPTADGSLDARRVASEITDIDAYVGRINFANAIWFAMADTIGTTTEFPN